LVVTVHRVVTAIPKARPFGEPFSTAPSETILTQIAVADCGVCHLGPFSAGSRSNRLSSGRFDEQMSNSTAGNITMADNAA
jgi:hypothetical protein